MVVVCACSVRDATLGHFFCGSEDHYTIVLASVRFALSCWACQELAQCIWLDLVKRVGRQAKVQEHQVDCQCRSNIA